MNLQAKLRHERPTTRELIHLVKVRRFSTPQRSCWAQLHPLVASAIVEQFLKNGFRRCSLYLSLLLTIMAATDLEGQMRLVDAFHADQDARRAEELQHEIRQLQLTIALLQRHEEHEKPKQREWKATVAAFAGWGESGPADDSRSASSDPDYSTVRDTGSGGRRKNPNEDDKAAANDDAGSPMVWARPDASFELSDFVIEVVEEPPVEALPQAPPLASSSAPATRGPPAQRGVHAEFHEDKGPIDDDGPLCDHLRQRLESWQRATNAAVRLLNATASDKTAQRLRPPALMSLMAPLDENLEAAMANAAARNRRADPSSEHHGFRL